MSNVSHVDSSQPKFLTLPEVCNRYKLSRSTLYRLHRSGELNIVKFGRASRVLTADVDAWAASLPVLGGRV